MNSEQNSIKERVERLEEEILEERKEWGASFFGSIKTLAADLDEFRHGRRDFPSSAAWGVVFAYMRRRFWLFLGGLSAGIGALVVAAAQVVILLNQNELLRRQVDSDRAQALAAAVAGMDPDDAVSTQVSLAQLQRLDTLGLDIMIRLIEAGSPMRIEIMEAISGLHDLPVEAQTRGLLAVGSGISRLATDYRIAMNQAESRERERAYYNSIGEPEAAPPPSDGSLGRTRDELLAASLLYTRMRDRQRQFRTGIEDRHVLRSSLARLDSLFSFGNVLIELERQNDGWSSLAWVLDVSSWDAVLRSIQPVADHLEQLCRSAAEDGIRASCPEVKKGLFWSP